MKLISLGLVVILLSSCASIVSKSSYPLNINSNPAQADIVIKKSNGSIVYQGNTPAVVELKSGEKFFKRASYTVTFTKEGYGTMVMPVEFKVDGWYWGNFIFGGWLGFFIIDPATGAMYKLKESYINGVLKSTTAEASNELMIYDINDISEDWKSNMELIK